MTGVRRRGTVAALAALAVLGGAGVAAAVSGPTPPSPAPPSSPPASPAAASPSGATSPTGSPAPPSPTHVATAAPSRPTASPIVDRVVAAAGVQQWLHCAGTGRVTVVVVTGLGAPASSWSAVRPDLERITRTCVYDRPGLGHSPARPDTAQVVDAGLHARELTALLAAAGERGPFVVVGHSYGGLIARAFVQENRSRVRALLLAESVTPDDPTTGRYWSEAGHRVDMLASSAATGGGPPLGRIPLLVLSASNPEEDHLGGPTYGQPQDLVDLWRAQQRDDVELSSDAIQVVAHSGHVLQQDDPPAVIEAVRELVAAVRTGRPLACTDAWRSDDAVCH